MDAKINLAEQATEYVFQNKLMVAEALQMAGIGPLHVNGKSQVIQKNQRLAILGSCLLHASLCEMWIKQHDQRGNSLSKGDWSTIVQNMLSNESLGHLGSQLGIDRCINQNAGAYVVSPHMLAETLKALLAAIYLDAGAQGPVALRNVVMHIGLDDHPLLMTFQNAVASAVP